MILVFNTRPLNIEAASVGGLIFSRKRSQD